MLEDNKDKTEEEPKKVEQVTSMPGFDPDWWQRYQMEGAEQRANAWMIGDR